jgi:hypothetical protein
MPATRTILATLILAGGLSAAEPGLKTGLPAAVYADSTQTLWIPSGYMGETAAITVTGDSRENPHSGATVMKVTYNKGDGWGGVVWQSPVNDWGAKPGGFDLTGAKRLAFWARGAVGGEKVKFGFGVIGADQPYGDTAKGEIEVTLTTEWQEFSVVPSGADLTRIKTGFMWVLGGQGAAVTFFLDDVRWE